MNNPNIYQIEAPLSNTSHQFEAPWDISSEAIYMSNDFLDLIRNGDFNKVKKQWSRTKKS